MAASGTYTVTILLDVNGMQDIDDRAESRTYIVADRDSGKAIIIDPVIENIERDLKIIEELGLTLIFAVETHIHADHITGAWKMKDRTGAHIVYGGGCQGIVTGVDMFLARRPGAACRQHQDEGAGHPWPHGQLYQLSPARRGIHRRYPVHTRQWRHGFSGRFSGQAVRLGPQETLRAIGRHDRLSRS